MAGILSKLQYFYRKRIIEGNETTNRYESTVTVNFSPYSIQGLGFLLLVYLRVRCDKRIKVLLWIKEIQ